MEELLLKYGIKERCESLCEHYLCALSEMEKCGREIFEFEKCFPFYELRERIKKIRDELLSDSDNLLYAYFLNAAIRAKDNKAIKILSSPRKEDESELYDSLPLFSLMREIPSMINEHRRRGVPKDVTDATVLMFENQVGDHIILYGRIGIAPYVSWMLGFIHCRMIRVGRFNLEICKYNSSFDGFFNGTELCLLANGERFHKSGQVLGSAFCEDEDGSFVGEIKEEGESFVGITARDGVAVRGEVRLNKTEWRRVLTKGDTVVSVHIPTGGKMSPETVEADLRRGEEIITSCFTDFKFFFCHSWLLDPSLETIVGKPTNVSRFGDKFKRFPSKSTASDVYEYVFDKRVECDPEQLVPKSSFAEAVKRFLVSGGRVYGASGIMPRFTKREPCVIPMSMHLVVDDVGWFNGEDDRKQGGPSRTGMPRRHVAEDYFALNRLGEALGMKVTCAFVVGEWDPDNRLRSVPHLSKFGENWNNAEYLDREEMTRVISAINSSPYIELAIHGLLHGYYMEGVDTPDVSDYYYLQNKKLYMTDEKEIEDRIGKFRGLLDYYGIKRKTDVFVPPCFRYRYGELSSVLSRLGIKYVSTIFKSMECEGERPETVCMENGIANLDRNLNLIPWDEFECPFDILPTVGGVFGAHWPNFLHRDPKRNNEIVDKAVSYFKRCSEVYGIVLSHGIEDATVQAFYHRLAKVEFTVGELVIDLSELQNTVAYGKPFIVSSVSEIKDCKGASVRLYERKSDFLSYELIPSSDRIVVVL